MTGTSSTRLAFVVVAFVIVVGASATQSQPSVSAAADVASLGEVLTPGRCYRLVFAIPGASQFKVLALVNRDWIKAEVDAGPAAAAREPLWINTAQIITVRQARCSE